MSAGHTPTPWVIDPYGNVLDAQGKTVSENGVSLVCSAGASQREAKENARFAVRAVNAHDDLVEALRGIRDMQGGATTDRNLAMKNIARAALSKAIGNDGGEG